MSEYVSTSSSRGWWRMLHATGERSGTAAPAPDGPSRQVSPFRVVARPAAVARVQLLWGGSAGPRAARAIGVAIRHRPDAGRYRTPGPRGDGRQSRRARDN